MKDQIAFESMIFREKPDFNYMECDDIDFMTRIFVQYPKIRPLNYSQFVAFSLNYMSIEELRIKILEKGIDSCPSLIYRLFLKGVFAISEVEEAILLSQKKYHYLFFKKYIVDCSPFIPEFDIVIDSKEEDMWKYDEYPELQLLIDYGFLPSSIEYCLKYDDIERLKSLSNRVSKQNVCMWNPFEWSNKPSHMDFLSFSSFFGSIQCFRFLLLMGYQLNDFVPSNAVCSGNFNIFYLCEPFKIAKGLFHKAAEYFWVSFAKLFLEEGLLIDEKDENGFSPLHYAALNGHLGMVVYLVDNMAFVNSQTEDKNTPLHYACKNDNINIVKYLIENKANEFAKESNLLFLLLV